MAPAPDTVLFPGLQEDAFVRAPEVADLAADVMARWDEFAPLRQALADGQVSIEYVFETKHFDQFKEEFKPHTVSKVSKASPLWSSLTGRDLVVQFRRTFWAAWGERQRSAELYHALSHIRLEDGESGAPRIALAPHDVEEFRATLMRYGPALPGRRALVDAAAAWSSEHPDPATLGSFAEAVMDRVAEQVNAGAMDGNGYTATMTRVRRADPCVRSGDECSTHSAAFPAVASKCWAVPA
jgi:hypothetical protein